MNDSSAAAERSYDDFYARFDSPLANAIRHEVYGRDIGQHSWVLAEELEGDSQLLHLSRASRLLDLGCGPGGPLCFVMGLTGCRAIGLDLSPEAIASATARARILGLQERITLRVADLDETLDIEARSFDSAISLDVVLHLRNRSQAFGEIARVLVPGGRFVFTDAGVITGAVSNEEIRLRSLHGHTQFVSPGFNECMLASAGLRLLDQVDRTGSLLEVSSRRQAVRLAHRAELESQEGVEGFDRQQRYLETVCALSRRKAVARVMYVAECESATR